MTYIQKGALLIDNLPEY